MVEVTWSDRARGDLQAIYEYVAEDSEALALRLIARIIAATLRLREFVESGRVVPYFEESGTREIIVRPYRIAYVVVGETAIILRVFHGARLIRPEDLSIDLPQ